MICEAKSSTNLSSNIAIHANYGRNSHFLINRTGLVCEVGWVASYTLLSNFILRWYYYSATIVISYNYSYSIELPDNYSYSIELPDNYSYSIELPDNYSYSIELPDSHVQQCP